MKILTAPAFQINEKLNSGFVKLVITASHLTSDLQILTITIHSFNNILLNKVIFYMKYLYKSYLGCSSKHLLVILCMCLYLNSVSMFLILPPGLSFYFAALEFVLGQPKRYFLCLEKTLRCRLILQTQENDISCPIFFIYWIGNDTPAMNKCLTYQITN